MKIHLLKKGLFIPLFLLFLGGACEKEGKSSEEPLEIELITIRGLSVCGDSCYLKNAKYKDTHHVINSQSTYESLFECNSNYELPVIDFSKYSLLAGSKAVGGICPTILRQHVIKYPKNNKIVYEIQIKEGGYTALGSAYYHALVPKIENQYDIEFIISVDSFVKNY